MINTRLVFTGLIVLVLNTAFRTTDLNEQNGREIMIKVENNITGYGEYVVNMNMQLFNKKGKSFQRNIITYSKEKENDGEQTLSIFQTPNDVKGMKILLHAHLTDEDDQWLYLPALNATKRVANENQSGAFMGSEIAYEDLGTRLLYKFDFELLREDNVLETACYIVRCYPKSKFSGYSYKDVYVIKDKYVPFYIEYFDRKKELLKTETIKFKKMKDESWLPSEMQMKNVKNGRKTKVTWTSYKFDKGLKSSFFLPGNIEKSN